MIKPRSADHQADIKARAAERARLAKERLKLAREKLELQKAAAATASGADAILAAVRAARDPSQRVQTNDAWVKARYLELIEYAIDGGDAMGPLKVLAELKGMSAVKLTDPNADELAGKTADDLREMLRQLAGWTEVVGRRLEEMERG